MLKTIAALSCVGLLASVAHATTFTSQLNCPIVGGTGCSSPTGSYGTITFSDVTGGVDIGVSLASGLTVQDIFFNYTTGSTVVPITATVTGGSLNNVSESVTNSPNNVTVTGSGNYGSFDVGIPSTGTLTQAGNNFTVALTTTLTASMIANSLDTNNLFDFALHLQNCGPNSGTCQPGQTGNNSLAVGELPTPAPTPEPSSLLLLGTGILGAAGVFHRRVLVRS